MKIKEIIEKFHSNELNEEEGDYFLIDGTEITLETEKDISFSGWAEDIVFDLLNYLGIPVQGA